MTQGCRCAPTAGLKLANAFGVETENSPFPKQQTSGMTYAQFRLLRKGFVGYAEGVC